MATFGTFAAGQVLTAAELNTTGAWTSYTPTFTQSATITKTVNWAKYMQLGDLVFVNLKMTASSAGTTNNKILIGLPVNASSDNFLMGQLIYFDASVTPKYVYMLRAALYESTSTVAFHVSASAASDGDTRWGQQWFSNGNIQSAVVIESGDVVYCQLMYEAA